MLNADIISTTYNIILLTSITGIISSIGEWQVYIPYISLVNQVKKPVAYLDLVCIALLL